MSIFKTVELTVDDTNFKFSDNSKIDPDHYFFFRSTGYAPLSLSGKESGRKTIYVDTFNKPTDLVGPTVPSVQAFISTRVAH